MRLALFGVTGRTGRLLLGQALAAGHMVTALVRDPARVEGPSDRLALVTGDVRAGDCVAATVAGAQAVLSVLGPSANRPDFAVSQGTANILTAMQAHGVRRLVLSTGAGVGDARDTPGLFHHLITALLKLTARFVYEDMLRVVELVRAADLDWTIVRVPMLTDGSAAGRVRVGYVGAGTGPRLARGDLAAFMLKQVSDSTYLRQAPVISN
jgi:putative NADH-flavin reductase